MDPDVSIALPAYNEAAIIEDSINKVRNTLLELNRPFEIITAENGSTDGTDIIVLNLFIDSFIYKLNKILYIFL